MIIIFVTSRKWFFSSKTPILTAFGLVSPYHFGLSVGYFGHSLTRQNV